MFAVILGAFGAHGLQGKLSVKQLAVYDTAVTYQMYHAIALIIVGMLYKYLTTKYLKFAAIFFLLGIICFSGSLYLLSCADWLQISGSVKKIIGPITPLGGLFFILGWLSVVLSGRVGDGG